MQIGFVNFNTEERKRVAKMMQMLQESEAVEELGIGRVRDHFSNTLFPGTSTLQHHAKYFVLLPSLYYDAAHNGRRFGTIRDVEEYIIKAEIQITRQLAEYEGGTKVGITGINTYKDALNDYKKYVKYNPTYIYGSGLATFGMIPNTSIYQLILEISREYAENPHNKHNKVEEETNDAENELTGRKQHIIRSRKKYDFFEGTTMPLTLTHNEATFLKEKITKSCKGSLLTFLLEKDNMDLPPDLNYYDLGGFVLDLDDRLRDIYNKSVLFSKLIHLVDWSFNDAYYTSFENDELSEFSKDEFVQLYQTYKDVYIACKEKYKSLFDYARPIDYMLTDFCENCYKAILNKGQSSLFELSELATNRERMVKRDRSKIGNTDYSNIIRTTPSYNEFRWSTVRTMVNEIKNPQ